MPRTALNVLPVPLLPGDFKPNKGVGTPKHVSENTSHWTRYQGQSSVAGSRADIVARGLDWCEPPSSANDFQGKAPWGPVSLPHFPSPRSRLPPRVGLAIVLFEVVQAARKEHSRAVGSRGCRRAGWEGEGRVGTATAEEGRA